MESGRSSSEKTIFASCRALPRVIASDEMNSIVTRPTPPMRRSISRYRWSVIPAMGARIRGGSIGTEPNRSMEPGILQPGAGQPGGEIPGTRLVRFLWAKDLGRFHVVLGGSANITSGVRLDLQPQIRPAFSDLVGSAGFLPVSLLRLFAAD